MSQAIRLSTSEPGYPWKAIVGLLGTDHLASFLKRQRWFGAKGVEIQKLDSTTDSISTDDGTRCHCPNGWLLSVLHVSLNNGEIRDYFLPLALAWDEAANEILTSHPKCVLVEVKRGDKNGVVYDAYFDPCFVRFLATAISNDSELNLMSGKLVCESFSPGTGRFDLEAKKVRPLGVEQSNTSVVLDEELVLKGYRMLHPGPCAELEIGRFLTEKTSFENSPPLVGAIQYVRPKREKITLAVVQGYVVSEGDGWAYTLKHLRESLGRLSLGETKDNQVDKQGEYQKWVRMLGQRTGQLHVAFAKTTGDPAFDPEPITKEDLGRWHQVVKEDLARVFELLKARKNDLPGELHEDLAKLWSNKALFEDQIEESKPKHTDTKKTRFHGDYHLAQVMVVGQDLQRDVQIIDFEGEQPRPGQPTLTKHCPLRDVAGMLRSFDYAGQSALSAAMADHPTERATQEKWIREWERQTTKIFLDGYAESARGCASFPSSKKEFQDFVSLFVLEKALYEINYEVNHRPDWVGIPIKGVLSLL